MSNITSWQRDARTCTNESRRGSLTFGKRTRVYTKFRHLVKHGPRSHTTILLTRVVFARPRPLNHFGVHAHLMLETVAVGKVHPANCYVPGSMVELESQQSTLWKSKQGSKSSLHTWKAWCSSGWLYHPTLLYGWLLDSISLSAAFTYTKVLVLESVRIALQSAQCWNLSWILARSWHCQE